jgi:hypothetical protein
MSLLLPAVRTLSSSCSRLSRASMLTMLVASKKFTVLVASEKFTVLVASETLKCSVAVWNGYQMEMLKNTHNENGMMSYVMFKNDILSVGVT